MVCPSTLAKELTSINKIASLSDMLNSSMHSIPVKNIDILERQARNLIALNCHSDLFATAAYQSLSTETMDSAMLSWFLEALA